MRSTLTLNKAFNAVLDVIGKRKTGKNQIWKIKIKNQNPEEI